jgi:hypothetical protein
MNCTLSVVWISASSRNNGPWLLFHNSRQSCSSSEEKAGSVKASAAATSRPTGPTANPETKDPPEKKSPAHLQSSGIQKLHRIRCSLRGGRSFGSSKLLVEHDLTFLPVPGGKWIPVLSMILYLTSVQSEANQVARVSKHYFQSTSL